MRSVGFTPVAAPPRFGKMPKFPRFWTANAKTPGEKAGNVVTAGIMVATGIAAWSILLGYADHFRRPFAEPPAATQKAEPEKPKPSKSSEDAVPPQPLPNFQLPPDFVPFSY